MRADGIALKLRPRTAYEASDLGIRLCQSHARDVYRVFLVVALPVFIVAAATYPIANGLPLLVIWWLKPWLDRVVLFVLSRAAFGQATTLDDLWRQRGAVLGGQLLAHLTLRRLSVRRSFTQPVYQLEGLGGAVRRQRLRQLRRRAGGAAAGITFVFSNVELCLTVGLFALLAIFAPTGQEPQFWQWLSGQDDHWLSRVYVLFYAMAVAFLEPFYVAAGFGLYLNRRVELEAWDIEQELRRAFG